MIFRIVRDHANHLLLGTAYLFFCNASGLSTLLVVSFKYFLGHSWLLAACCRSRFELSLEISIQYTRGQLRQIFLPCFFLSLY